MVNDIPRPVSDDELNDYIDGVVSEERAGEIEKILAKEPDLAATVFAYRSQNEEIRSLYDPVLIESVPEHLLSGLQENRGTGPMGTIMRLAASLVIAVVGFGGGWVANDRLKGTEHLLQPYIEQAALAYRMTGTEDKINAKLAATPGASIPDGFLAASVSGPLRLPTLRRWQFRPVALSSTTSTSGASVNVTYTDDKKRKIMLLVRQLDARREIPFKYTEEAERPVLYWIDGPYVYLLVSDASKEELTTIARDIYSTPAILWQSERPAVAPQNEAPAVAPRGEAAPGGRPAAFPNAQPKN